MNLQSERTASISAGVQHKITVNYLDTARECAQQLIGRAFTDEELAYAVGALDSAIVEVRQKKGADELRLEIHHPSIAEQRRWMRRDQHGVLIIVNYRFYKARTAPKEVGLDSLQRQVLGAWALGVQRLETFATGDYRSSLQVGGEVGYLVWAKYGFDAPLPEKYLQLLALTPSLWGVTTLNELMNRPGGEAWWHRFGTGLKMKFDLSPDSSMMEVFQNCLRRKGRQI